MEEPARGLDRREFTRQTLMGLLSGVAVTITGCGGGGGGGGGASPTGASGTSSEYGFGGPTDPGGGAVASIGANHGHRAVITRVQLDAGGAATVDIQGTATHPHAVTLSGDEVVAVRSGQRVSKTSSSGDGDAHSHMVTFNA